MGVLALVTSHRLLTRLTLRGVIIIGGSVGGAGVLLSGFLESWSAWSHLLGART